MITRAVLSTAIVVLTCARVLGDGLIYQLPPDGHWASFKVDGRGKTADGSDVTMQGTLKLSSVGKVDMNGESYRWIELELNVKHNGSAVYSADKLLIPEKHLVSGGSPLEHVARYWKKPTIKSTAKERNLNGEGVKYALALLSPYLHGPFDDVQRSSAIKIETALGELECPGLSARDTIELPGGVIMKKRYWIRGHRRAPFGVVAWAEEEIIERNKEHSSSMTRKLILESLGTDAVSVMPDAR
jgi:hypothetical protein